MIGQMSHKLPTVISKMSIGQMMLTQLTYCLLFFLGQNFWPYLDRMQEGNKEALPMTTNGRKNTKRTSHIRTHEGKYKGNYTPENGPKHVPTNGLGSVKKTNFF